MGHETEGLLLREDTWGEKGGQGDKGGGWIRTYHKDTYMWEHHCSHYVKTII